MKDQLTVIETKINTLIKYSLKTKISPTSLTQVYLDAERFHNPLMESTKKLEFRPVLPVFFQPNFDRFDIHSGLIDEPALNQKCKPVNTP